MEKNGKEHETSKHRSYFVMKVLLLVLFVVVAVLLTVVANNFASLKDLKDRLNALEEEKILDFKSLRNEKREHGPTRNKRSTDDTDIKNALMKLEKR
jgi:biopolymer transport protein ExbB/TolQ